ncbi:MAG: helix-turn-helix domain-containing protein [Flavipsychrobacter sp.]
METTYYLKGMVCYRCISAVERAFYAIGYNVTNIHLGAVSISTKGSLPDTNLIEATVTALGLSLIEDKKTAIVRQVKDIITNVYSGDFDFPYSFRLSSLLQKQLQQDYDTISSIFSATEGITLEKYAINYRLRKAKEYLLYSNYTLNEIAFKIGYNSAAHFARQFKELTGLTTKQYKLMCSNKTTTELTA